MSKNRIFKNLKLLQTLCFLCSYVVKFFYKKQLHHQLFYKIINLLKSIFVSFSKYFLYKITPEIS